MLLRVFSLENPWIPQISSRFSRTVRFGATAVSCGDTPISRLTCSGSFTML